MPSDQRDPELEKLAELLVQKWVDTWPERTSFQDAFYVLLERDIIEVGPGLFR